MAPTLTWIPVAIRSIKKLKSTRNSLFHKYMHILIYMYINEQTLPKMCKTHGGVIFCTLRALGSHFSGPKNGFVSSVCDLWPLWPFVKSSRPEICDRRIDLIATVSLVLNLNHSKMYSGILWSTGKLWPSTLPQKFSREHGTKGSVHQIMHRDYDILYFHIFPT